MHAAPDAPALLRRASAWVEAHLDRVLPPAGTGAGRLTEALRYAVFAGGKRLRPALALASCEAVGGEPDAAVAFAGAVELVHTYSLVHDDLPAMDDDDLRRGRPTTHKVFGEAIGILVGDALHSLAFESLLERTPDASVARRLGLALARAAGVRGMVGGQVDDLDSTGVAPTEERLERLHRGKTAALLAASCEGGAIAGGARPEQVEALHRFGLDLGLAFQVVDDVLDATGTAASLGKTPGKDRDAGKMTYVALEGVERARARAADLLARSLAALAPLPRSQDLAALARFVVERDR
ncbi:MAG: polyprenyl synthetase family protein [Planctomycetes bacterium]|nr:polyprenyl synthetase family protein [Planctomycetota bacterium]